MAYNIAEFCREYLALALWFEPKTEIFQLAVQYNDLKKYLDSKRLRHIDKIPKDEELQKLFEDYANSEIIFCSHRASYKISSEYLTFQERARNFLNRKSVNAFTLARFERLWMRNILANFETLLQARPVKELFYQNHSGSSSGDSEGKPLAKIALVCGAGPSLLYDMEAIKALRKKLLLIAVDTALKPLLGHGIDPDIVLCVDPQALSRHYIEGYEGTAVFVVDPASSYLALRSLAPEKVFYFSSPFALAKLLFEFLDIEPGEIASGGSVSTNAYDLALRMGCDIILLAGHDLAFTEKLNHVQGAALEERIYHKQDRLFSGELHNHYETKGLPLRYIEADSGEKSKQLPTNDKLMIFHQWFSRRLQSDLERGKQIAKLSPRGAKLGNIQVQELESQLLKDFSFDPLVKPKKFQEKSQIAFEDLCKNFASWLKSLAQDFEVYAVKVKRGLELVKTMSKLRKQEQSEDHFRVLAELEKIEKEIVQEQKVSTLLSHILQGLISQIKNRWKISQKDIQNTELEIFESSCKLYTGLLEAAEIYQKSLLRRAKSLSNKGKGYNKRIQA